MSQGDETTGKGYGSHAIRLLTGDWNGTCRLVSEPVIVRVV